MYFIHRRYESVREELLEDRGMRVVDRLLARLYSQAMVRPLQCTRLYVP